MNGISYGVRGPFRGVPAVGKVSSGQGSLCPSGRVTVAPEELPAVAAGIPPVQATSAAPIATATPPIRRCLAPLGCQMAATLSPRKVALLPPEVSSEQARTRTRRPPVPPVTPSGSLVHSPRATHFLLAGSRDLQGRGPHRRWCGRYLPGPWLPTPTILTRSVGVEGGSRWPASISSSSGMSRSLCIRVSSSGPFAPSLISTAR